MATFAATITRQTWIGPMRMLAAASSNAMESTFEPLEVTNDQSAGVKERAVGLETVSFEVSGMVPSSSNTVATNNLTLPSGLPISVALATTAGSLVSSVSASMQSRLALGVQIGQVQTISLGYAGAGQMLRGATTLAYATRTAAGATNGAGVNFGAIGANETAYFVILRADDDISGTSPTLNGVVESDASDAWIGAETTRATMTEETDATAGYQVITVAGPITDTWWRFVDTVGGTTPNITFWVYMAKVAN